MEINLTLSNPEIKIVPNRRDFLVLTVECTPDFVSEVINEITTKIGFRAIFESLQAEDLKEMYRELAICIEELK